MKKVSMLVKGAMFAGMSLVATSSMASHIPNPTFNILAFDMDLSAYGIAAENFTNLDTMVYTYEAEVDQSAGVFSETGLIRFSSFLDATTGNVVGPFVPSNYLVYALFSVGGTVAANGAQVDVTFNSFSLDIWVDDNSDTTFTAPTIGGVNESYSVTGGAMDDVNILSGQYVIGGAHVTAGLAGGDYASIFEVTSYDTNVWGGDAFNTAFNEVTWGDFNGNNSSIIGVGGAGSNFTDALIEGSGGMTFAIDVPEPATLALFGLGLMGLCGVKRRNS